LEFAAKIHDYAVKLRALGLLKSLRPESLLSLNDVLERLQLLESSCREELTRAETEQVNSIRRVGEVWQLRYEGEAGDYPSQGNKAIGWLAKLLALPNRQLTIAELYDDAKGLAADAALGEELENDKQGLRAIYNSVSEIDQLDPNGESERLQEQKAQLLDQLKEWRYKRLDSPLRRAYSNVATQLRNLYRIGDRHNQKKSGKLTTAMPRLAAHLKAYLKLDYPHVGYFPPKDTPAWKF